MVDVHIDPRFDDEQRRERLFSGDVVVYTHIPEIVAFAEFARELIAEAFAPLDPLRVQEHRDPGELAEVLIPFKPRFIHHPESIAHVRRIVTALGGDPESVYADVPKLRTAFPAGGLTTGIAYAFQPHRDTWYSAPLQQLNWWLPLWPVAPSNVMEFYPQRFGRAVANTSRSYDYVEWNAWRSRMSELNTRDTRVHPAPVAPLPPDEPRLCLVPPVGGVMLFSGDQLHASIPNTSGVARYSVDFRTVDIADLRRGRGAPGVDVEATGTSLGDFHRLSDGSALPAEEVAHLGRPAAVPHGA